MGFVRKKRSLNLSHKITLGMILFAIIGLVLAFIVVNTLVHRIVYDSILESTLRDRTIQAQQVDAWFQEAGGIVESLAETLPLVPREYYQDIVIHILDRYDFAESVWVALEDGGFYDSAVWMPPYWFVSMERPWWLAAESVSGEVAITLPYVSVEIDDIVTTFARHVSDWNGQEGVVSMNIVLEQVEAMMNGFQLGAEGYLILTGPGGEVIFHPNREYMPAREGTRYIFNLREYATVFDEFAGGAAIVNYFCKYGISSYYMQFPLPSTGWTFISVIPATVASDPVWQILSSVIFTISMVLAVVLALSLVFVSRSAALQKRAEAHEREAAELARNFFDSSPAFIEIWDENFDFVSCNKKAAELFGLSDSKEFVERYAEFSPEYQPCGKSSDEKWIEMAKKALKEGTFTFEWMHLTADGKPLPVETTFLSLDNGMLMGHNHDLREIRAAMERTRELEMKVHEQEVNERVRIMFDAAPVIIDYWNKDNKIIDCNKYAIDFYGFKDLEEYVSQELVTLPDVQPDGTPTLACRDEMLGKIFREGSGKFELVERKLNGEPVCLEVEGIRLKDANSNEDIVITYSKDVTHIKLFEKQQAERRTMELAQKLADNSPVFMELWDTEGSIIYCSDKMLDVFGVSDKVEFMKRYYDFSTPYQSSGIPSEDFNIKMIEYAIEHGSYRNEWTFLLPNGEEMSTETTWVYIMHEEKPMIIAYCIDLRPIKAAIESEESSQAKSRFLARMSHEIRTPISAVLGISEVQLRNQNVPPQIEEAFAKIYDSSKMLLNIVNDILDLSKIESGKMTLNSSVYDVAGLVSDASYLQLIYSESKDVSFKINVDKNLPKRLNGDALKIRQIIGNLLTNSFKYTESGEVALSLQCEKASEGSIVLVISIQDTGLGMSATQIEDLKGEYVRLHEKEKPFKRGTGLGIPIVYSLAKIMGAEFDLFSEVGKGTNAVIRIPQEVASDEILGQEMVESLQNFESKAWSIEKDLEFEFEQMQGLVLVVDDVDTNLYVAEAMLESFGVTVELSESGEAAIEKVKQGSEYDIIFMDQMMPGIDGVETTKTLRSMGYNRPIIALTANAIKGQAEMFMNNGFSGFMAKPIDIKLLNAYLVRFIKSQKRN